MSAERSTVTLRALSGTPLRDAGVRRIVLATARAIAERHNVELVSLEATDQRVTATLGTHRLAAIGFIAELRRLTTAWYQSEHPGAFLWGETHDLSSPDEDGDDPADWWKRA